MEQSIYEIQKEAVIIDHNILMLITDPSNELIDLAFRSYMSKIVAGLPLKLNSKMLILFIKYESNLLKQKMINKRKMIISSL